MSLIEINNVTKQYHKGDETITPLDGVTLSVEEGEFLALMGASGTGKSTLLNLVASMTGPTAARLWSMESTSPAFREPNWRAGVRPTWATFFRRTIWFPS